MEDVRCRVSLSVRKFGSQAALTISSTAQPVDLTVPPMAARTLRLLGHPNTL